MITLVDYQKRPVTLPASSEASEPIYLNVQNVRSYLGEHDRKVLTDWMPGLFPNCVSPWHRVIARYHERRLIVGHKHEDKDEEILLSNWIEVETQRVELPSTNTAGRWVQSLKVRLQPNSQFIADMVFPIADGGAWAKDSAAWAQAHNEKLEKSCDCGCGWAHPLMSFTSSLCPELAGANLLWQSAYLPLVSPIAATSLFTSSHPTAPHAARRSAVVNL